MHYTQEELKAIQQLEFDILCDVKLFCEQENIEYFLIGGTCLGAFRHDGFIPWDDDIDIGMTRENYEKFLVSASKGLGKKYFIQAIETEPDCPYPYCKVQDNTGSMFVEYSNHRLDIHRGVFIDVLPFDEVPDDFEAYTKQYKTMRRLFRMFMLNTMPDIGYPPKGLISLCKNTIRKIVHLICRLVFIKDKLYWQMKREMTRYNGTGQKAISCLFFPQIKKDYIEKTNLYPLLSHRFEQAEFPVPNNLDTYLTTHYGDYMQLPPPEKRYGHRPYQVSLKCTDRCNKKILGEI